MVTLSDLEVRERNIAERTVDHLIFQLDGLDLQMLLWDEAALIKRRGVPMHKINRITGELETRVLGRWVPLTIGSELTDKLIAAFREHKRLYDSTTEIR